jgi:hypothetical protein
MPQIPIYLKTDPQMPRPEDPEFYWITADGTFLGRNHKFFVSDVPTRKAPRALQPHHSFCRVRFPKLRVAMLEYIVGFFDRVYELHGAESIVLLFWNQRRSRYKLWVPQQKATVWESYAGVRTALDVTYELPVPLPSDHLLLADIHCHCDFGADASYTDRRDEMYRDGVHAIVGRIDREPPEFRVEISIDGSRFVMRFDQLFRGYHRRRRSIPQKWLDAVQVEVKRPQAMPRHDSSNWSYGSYTRGYDA